MWHGFLPGGIQPGGGLALPVLVILSLCFTLRCLSPAFLRKGLNYDHFLKFITKKILTSDDLTSR